MFDVGATRCIARSSNSMALQTSQPPSDLPPLIKLKYIMGSLAEVDLNTPFFSPAPTSSTDSFSWTLPQLLKSNQDGLAHVPTEILSKCIRPVLEGMESIDAESLLSLQRMAQGAALAEGIRVKPVHDQIKPACVEGTVRYIHLSDMQGQYSMGIFVFPPHSKIPLHDHPGMCVLSRVLYGSLHRLSLDLARDQDHNGAVASADESHQQQENNNSPWAMSWTTSEAQQQSQEPALPFGSLRAHKNHVDYLEAPQCTVLYPFEGNLHEFIAGPDGAAVLDVLFPPYDEMGRDCTFYNIMDDPDEMRDGTSDHHEPCWIVPTGQPEDFHCISGIYKTLGAPDC
mmetsp:Transcript_29291/g.80475  ORF Transcript_29291/g.80475 Transcript_29291/m.80475 type:complete len:341 (-) Transcript_29291:133-1155(-)